MRNSLAVLLSHHSLDLVEKVSSLFFVSHRRPQIIKYACCQILFNFPLASRVHNT